MAATPEGRAEQLARYRDTQRLLQERLSANEKRIPSERTSVEKIVISTSDPEAALGPDKFKTFRPLYNVLTIIDLNSPLVLAYDLFSKNQDTALLEPMLRRSRGLTGTRLKDLVGDSGFVTGMNLAHCEAEQVNLIGPWKENDFSARKKRKKKESPEAAAKFSKDQFTWRELEDSYVCPAGQRLRRVGRERRRRAGDQEEAIVRYGPAEGVCASCPLRSQCTDSKHGRQLRRSQHEALIQAHRAKMETDPAKALLRRRGQTAELGFADLKEHRGLRRFSRRRQRRAATEVGLWVLIHNLLVVDQHTAALTAVPTP